MNIGSPRRPLCILPVCLGSLNAEQIHQRHLHRNGCVERMLGQLVVADGQLFEYGPLVTDDLQNGQMLLDAFYRELVVEFAHLRAVPESFRRSSVIDPLP